MDNLEKQLAVVANRLDKDELFVLRDVVNNAIAELTSLRQYKAEAESQKPIGTCKVWNAGGSGELRELWGIENLTHEQPVYARPVPSGSCAVSEGEIIQQALEKSSLCMACFDGGYLLYSFDKNKSGRLQFSFWSHADLMAWANKTYAIPSNSEGEKS